jgi:hypothetical protein
VTGRRVGSLRHQPVLGAHLTHLVTLDPGTRHLAVSGWERVGYDLTDPGRPVPAWELVTATDLETPYASVDTALAALRGTIAFAWAHPAAALVAEWPSLYDTRRVTHGTVRELRAVVEAVEAQPWAACARVAPRTWKQTTPKPIHHARLARALTDAEREAWWDDAGPDARDAIGIGLWATRRHP